MTAGTDQVFITNLVNTHGERLHRFLYRRVRNIADVPDLVQEVFLRMLRVPDRDAIRSPEAYLFTIALHVARQHSLRESTLSPSIEANELFLERQPDAESDPALQASTEQALVFALTNMSPKVRATFVLHRSHGMTLHEIARELGISFPMAKKYLVKALVQFRQHFSAAED